MLARFLDGVVVSVILAGVIGIAGGGDATRAILAAVLAVAYDTVAVAAWGQTLGKHASRTAVVDARGGTVTWAQAATRAVVLLLPISLLAPRIDTVGEWAVLVLVLANFVVVARRRDDRRGLHDLAARTRPIAVS